MTDIVSSGEMTELRAQVSDAIGTAALLTSITYVAVSAQTFDATTGLNARTATETAMNALVFPMKMAEVTKNADRYKAGDVVVSVAVADISEPKEADRVKIGSTEHEIVDWMQDSMKSKWRIVARKV